jgi:hypothetical protein
MSLGRAALASAISLSLAGCASYGAQQDELPMAYLQKAMVAVKARNAEAAIAQIDQAETAWLGANYPHGAAEITIDPDAVRDIGRARQAVQLGLWGDAEYYVRTAMTHPSAIQPLYPFFLPGRPTPNGPAAYVAAPGAAPVPAAAVPAAPAASAGSY